MNTIRDKIRNILLENSDNKLTIGDSIKLETKISKFLVSEFWRED